MNNEVDTFVTKLCNEFVGGFRDIHNALRKQNSVNNRVFIFAIATAAYMVVTDKRIHKLEKEVEELKNQKGE